ncbi:HlyD family type I secretion periplasmic adaptor subunit [Carnimonas bestiolae]|uniref:HlyD family type I secretion periplasmic adaptor subunit n=1 Tax=Carnimonas bestiolae TaxID=3402172 RepID=UPI003EDC732E
MAKADTQQQEQQDSVPDWQKLAQSDSEAQQTPDKQPARLGWWILLIAFLVFLAWAIFAPLDNGVTASGVVTVTGERKTVDTLTGGIIERLLVNDGDSVKAGDPLVRLDPTQARSELGEIDSQLQSAQARRARLIAERDRASHVDVPKALANTPAMQLELALFASRKAALEGQLAGIQASLSGKQSLRSGLEASLSSRTSQRELLNEQWQNLKGLADGGYVARNRLLEIAQQRSQLDGDIASDRGQLGQVRGDIGELQMRAQSTVSDFQQQVSQDLSDASNEIDQLQQRRGSADFQLHHQLITAPVDGVVVNLKVHTEGGVAQAGDQLMEVVPNNQPLTVEGQLPVDNIDRVHTGLPVELSFTAFNRSVTPRLDGEVSMVSADRLEDEHDGHPYYKIRVSVPPEQVARLDGRELQAGMPVEIFVRTGERSLINYLFKPLFDRARTAWGD